MGYIGSSAPKKPVMSSVHKASKVYKPTVNQRNILSFIEEYFALYGTCPTYREIASGMGKASMSGVHYSLKNLLANDLILEIELPGGRKVLRPANAEVTIDELRRENSSLRSELEKLKQKDG